MKYESQLQIVTAAGVAPFTVNQTQLVINLNADLLDGQEGSFYQNAGNLNAGTLLAARLPAFTGGDVTSTAGTVALTLANSGVAAGTYRSVTVDAKGRVTAGTNPTTLAGYGITDALDTSSTAQTKGGNLTLNGYLTSRATLPSMSAVPYNWNGTTMSYYWTKIANISTVGDAHVGILITTKTDVNYTPYGVFILSLSAWNGTNQSIKLDSLISTDITFRVRIDNSGDVWILSEAQWSSYLTWRIISMTGSPTLYTSSFTQTLTTPANSVEILSGQSVRGAQGSIASATVSTTTANVFGNVFSRGDVNASNGTVYASNFSGPGNGLTGTAAGLSIGGSAAQLNGQSGSYYENRDITAVGFASGTLTFTRAAGNLTISMDGRYVPISGGTMTGSLIVQGGSSSITAMHSGNAAQWYGKIATINGTSDRQVFLGTYGTVGAIGSVVNSTGAWNDLYINTVDGSTGGTVRMPSSVLINGNQALHNGTTSAPNLSIGGSAASTTVSDTRSTATTPQSVNAGVFFDFKQNATESLTDGGTFFGEMTFRQYGSGTDWTGGKSHQLGFTDNGNIWQRSGSSTTWGAWKQMLDSANYSNYALSINGGSVSGTLYIYTTSSSTGATPVFPFGISRQTSRSDALLLGVDGNADAVIAANDSALRLGKVVSGVFTEYAKIGTTGNMTVFGSVTASSFSGAGTGLTGTASSLTAGAVPWSGVTGKPTTLSGYGITDALDTSATAQTKSGNLTVNSALTSGGAFYAATTVQYANRQPVYTLFHGGAQDLAWKKIADITFGTGLYAAATFKVDVVDSQSNFGYNSACFPMTYFVSCRRSGGVQDDYNDAVVYGPVADYVRVVKTATGVYELQIRQIADWLTHIFTVENTIKGAGTVTLVTGTPANGSTTGTIYTATAGWTQRLPNLSITSAATIGGTLGVTGVATFGSAATFSAASGTYINTGGGADAFGYNATAGYGHYIKGTGNTYIYGGGLFYDGSAIRTLLHSNNYSSYALPLSGGNVTGSVSIIGQTINGQSHYQWEGATYRNPGDWTASAIIRRDNATSGINGHIPALVLYNNNGGDQTTVGLSFASAEGATGQGNAVALAGIVARKEGAGSVGAWSSGSLNFYVKNAGNRVDAINITSTGTVNALVALQQGGNQVLHAGNVSTYALPIGGGTLTGNLTLSGSSQLFVGSHMSLQSSSSIMGMIGFNRRVSDGAIFNSSYGAYQLHNDTGTLNLQVYTSAGTFVGAHTFNGSGAVSLFGTLNAAGAITQSGNQVLHAGNYNSYALPITGGTLTGGLTGTTASFSGTLAATGAITQNGNQVLHAGNYLASYIVPQTNYTTVVDASGYTWIRIPYASTSGFNEGQSPIEFYVTRSIYDNSSTPYGGPTAKFVIQSMEWHSGQQMATVQYGERGDSSSLGASNWITHAKVTNLSGGGYWVYLRLKTGTAAGVTYMFRRAAIGGQGINFSAIESTTDPSGAARLYYGFNLISAGTEARFYRDGNVVLDAGNYNSYAPTLTGTGASGNWPINITGQIIRSAGVIADVQAPGSGTFNKHQVYANATEFAVEAALATDVVSGTTLPIYLTWRGGYATQGGLKVTGASSAELGGNVIVHAGNVSTYALPISGGTLSGNLTINGNLTSGAGYQQRWSDGSAAAPGYSFYADTDTGIHRSADNTLAIVTGGVIRVTIDGSGNLAATGAISGTSFSGTSGAFSGALTSGGNSVLTVGNYGSYAVDNTKRVKQFFWDSLGASTTQARRFEIARIAIDIINWNQVGTFEIELCEQYYSKGLKKKYVVWYGYSGTRPGLKLVEMSGAGDNNFQVVLGTEQPVSGNQYYLPIYVDVRYYSFVDVRVTTSRQITSNSTPPVGYTYINSSPSPTNIADFTADSTVDLSNAASAWQVGGNTILTSATTSAPNLSIGGSAAQLNGQAASYYLNASNLTAGTVPAAQMPSHTGDVTSTAGSVALTIVANAVTTAKINNSAVTYAKIQNVGVSCVLGNNSASVSQAPVEIGMATLAGMLSGQTMNIAGSSTSCTGNAVTATTATNIADGAVATTAKLANSVVTYAKMQNVGASSVLGNTSASVSQAPQEITFANLNGYLSGAAKAWATFSENPSTGAITVNASFGISSVTRLSAGVYQVNFSSAFSDANYAVSGAIGFESNGSYLYAGFLGIPRITSPKATGSCIVSASYSDGNNYNARYVHVVFHR